MKAYLDALDHVLTYGQRRLDRTGVGTLGVFGLSVKVNLQKGFPLLTTKKIKFGATVAELIWMMRGQTNTNQLKALGAHFWDKWADERGELGPVYGAQWRDWGGRIGGKRTMLAGIDQLSTVVSQIRRDPFSRRHLVSAWNVEALPFMRLPPCHYAFQFWVSPGLTELSCIVSMRSLDVFIGLPFDIALYALLTHAVAHLTGLKPGSLQINACDAHLYVNHVEQAAIQLAREPRELPTLTIEQHGQRTVDDFDPVDFKLSHYSAHPPIKAEVAI